jgi:trk system potassium uptake protein TrkH
MTTVATGGFSTATRPSDTYQDPGDRMDRGGVHDARLDPVPALCAGAAGTVPSRFWRDQQVRLSGFLAVAILAGWMSPHFRPEPYRNLDSFRAAAFKRGLHHDRHRIRLRRLRPVGRAVDAFFFIIMFIGGCAGSTSCGIKIFRFQVLIEAVRQHVSPR